MQLQKLTVSHNPVTQTSIQPFTLRPRPLVPCSLNVLAAPERLPASLAILPSTQSLTPYAPSGSGREQKKVRGMKVR